MENGKGNSNTNLIINYLPQTLTDDEFRGMFLSIGPLQSCKIIRDRNTNYSYGFGFVDYENEADSQRAIEQLNGLQLQNKRLKVALARSGEGAKGANLYIRNLPKDIMEDELKDAFSEFGNIINSRVLTDQNSGLSKGVGFLLFEKREEADSAISSYDGKSLPGYTEVLSVKYADDNRGKARAPPGQARGRGGFPAVIPRYASPRGGGGPYGAPAGPYGAPRSLYGAPGTPYGAAPYEYDAPPGPMRSMGGLGGRHRYNPVAPYSTPAMTMGADEDEGYILFIYNIDPNEDERFLWKLFAPYGAVQKVNMIIDKQTGKGKGYGFATMTNHHEAVNAIRALNGFSVDGGKALQVSFKTSK